jgi:N-acetylglutamate synthase-like GNAT family acetyltransferase
VAVIHVRDATPADEPAALEVSREAFAELRAVYVPGAESVNAARQQSGRYARLVAEVHGAVVGTLTWAVEGDRVHLRALAVAAPHRRHGVARTLTERCAALARGLGLRAVSAYAIKETGNLAVFERLGFGVVSEEVTTTATTQDGRPVTEVYLERRV